MSVKYLLFLLLVIAGTASAKPIVVKSGEHGDFTRLVIYTGANQDWTVEDTEDGYVFEVANWSEGFETSDVFQKIGRDRVASLETGSKELRIRLGCACVVLETPLEYGFVQLDIRAQEPDREVAVPVSSVLMASVASDEKINEDSANTVLPWSVLDRDARRYSALDEAVGYDNAISLEAFQLGLKEQLASSSTREHLEPSGSDVIIEQREVETPSRSREDLLAVLSGRAAFSSAEQDRAGDTLRNPTPSNNPCGSGPGFQTSTWADKTGFVQQLSELRSKILSEFDLEIDGAALKLAKFYIFFNMPQEALQVLETFDVPVEGARETRSIGLALMSEFADLRPEVAEYTDCLDEAGFWGTLNSPVLSDLEDEQVANLLSWFSRQPIHLQNAIAQRVIDVLSNANREAAANVVRNTIELSLESDQRIQTQPELRGNWSELSVSDLEDLVNANDEHSALALALLLEKLLKDGVAPSPSMVTLAGAIAFQLDGIEVAKRLNSARVLSLLALGQIDLAAEGIFALSDGKLSDVEATLNSFMRSMIENATPPQVALFTWKVLSSPVSDELSSTSRMQLAQFFVDIGQPQLSGLILQSEASDVPAAHQRINSQVQALQGQEALAIESLGPDPDLASSAVLERVFVQERPSEAWEFRDRFRHIDEGSIAWLSERWDDIPENDRRFEVANLLSSETDILDDPEKPITTAQAAFSRSQAARLAIADLMSSSE